MNLGLALTTLAAMAAAAILCAVVVLAGHALWWRRHARHDAATRELAIDFALYVMGRRLAGDLHARVAAAGPRVFWAALEVITENIEGEEWARLSATLSELPPVGVERRRLERSRTWRRALAARRLGMLFGTGSDLSLLRALERGPESVMLPAALATARHQDPAALEWLLAHPERTSHLGRHILVVVLKRFGERAAPLLRRAVRRRRPTGLPIELAALDLLGLLRDRRSRVLLEGLTAHAEMEVRVTACRALGRLASKRSAPALLERLTDLAWQVRAQAARALGEIAAPEALLPLARLAGDSSWWVRRRAAYALGALGAEGEAALLRIGQGADRYAADFAAEVLEVLAWEREWPGGLERRVD